MLPTFEDWLNSELQKIRNADLWREPRCVTSLPLGRCQTESGRNLVNFAGNDYLGLAHHPKLKGVVEEAILCGGGASASPLVSGRSPWQVKLENSLSRFFGEEAALVFPSGFAANLGTLSALLDSETTVFCDRASHACLIDGCKLSGAMLRVFRNRELEELERRLSKITEKKRAIVCEGLSSMEGEVAPILELVEIARTHHSLLVIDEAHSIGTIGKTGRGALELLEPNSKEVPGRGNHEQVSIVRIGTLSKALASQGGFVSGSQLLIDFLRHRAHPYMFSTALSPVNCAIACTTLELLEQEPERVVQLRARSEQLRLGVQSLIQRGVGLSISNSQHLLQGPIVSIGAGEAQRALAWARALEESGFLVAAIRPPTVPHQTSRLRLTVTVNHTADVVDSLLDALAKTWSP